jgi:hypothetical protein
MMMTGLLHCIVGLPAMLQQVVCCTAVQRLRLVKLP